MANEALAQPPPDPVEAAWLDLETAEVSYLFTNSAISHAVFKGSAAAEVLGVPRHRSVDVDVLVSPADAARASQALKGNGFQDLQHGLRRSERSGHSMVFRRDAGPEVDVHFTYPGIASGHDLLATLEPSMGRVPRAGRHVPTLGRPAHLMILVLTVAREGADGWAVLRLQALRQDADLQEAARLARACGADAAFSQGLAVRPAPQMTARASDVATMALLGEVLPSEEFMRASEPEPHTASLTSLHLRRWGRLVRAGFRSR